MNDVLDDDTRRARTDRTVDELLRLLLAHDMAGFARLWAPDGVMEFPFAPPGYPARLEGRAAVTEYLAGYTAVIDIRRLVSETRHHSLDPDTVIVEFEVDAVGVATGRPFQAGYVAVITVTGQGITSYRDYWNPSAAADALGTDRTDLHRAFSGGAR